MIKRVTTEDYQKYNKFIDDHPNGHFLQSLRWADFKNKQKSYAVMSLDNSGNIRGAMLLFEQNLRRLKKKFLYCPRGPVCSRNDTEALTELLLEAEKISNEIGAYKLTLDPDISDSDLLWIDCFKEHNARIGDNAFDNGILQPFSVYRINVEKSDDDLLASYHSKARYSVRSSVKSAAICRVGERKDIPVFAKLLAETARRDGFTARDENYFFEMYDSLGEEMVKIFIVEVDGYAIAGSVLIKCAGKTWHMYAGSNDEFKETLPNFLMQWEMMRWSRDNGCFIYDMRGIAGEGDKLTPIEGLVRFKKRFGGDLCTFLGRIDIVYDNKTDKAINLLKKGSEFVKKLLGRK